MEKNFPLIITELRKSRGISQKEAAEKLGISQALLSHYEKGIRECGQSFLVRIADFYDVSVDYLLGRETDPNRIGNLLAALDEDSDDWSPNDLTLLRAAILLKERLSQRDAALAEHYITHLSVQLYRVILQQTRLGNLPKSWAGIAFSDGDLYANDLYLQLIDQTQLQEVAMQRADRPSTPNEAPPDAIRQIVSRAEDHVFATIAAQLPPFPPRFLK